MNKLEEELNHYKDAPTKIGFFTAGSNLTGIINDIYEIVALLKLYGAISILDLSFYGPYIPLDLNFKVDCGIDAVFYDPERFIGGIKTPGILICKRSLLANEVPHVPSGGTV